jgi:PAS domain S-box-containing protein
MSQRDLTIRRALVITVLIGLIIPALLIGGMSWLKKYDEDVQKRTEEMLHQYSEILAESMREPLRNKNQESAGALVDALLRNPDIIRIDVHDIAGTPFVSGERPERRGNFAISAILPIKYGNSTIGSAQVEVSNARLVKSMVDALNQYLLALLAQIVLSVVLIMVLLEKRLVGPLRRLGAGAEKLAQGQLYAPFTWTRLDEIGLFSQRLEATRISLRDLFQQLDSKNRELESDIAKRKQVEQELHEREEAYRLSQAKFSSAFHGSPDFISLSRLDNGLLLDINEAYERFIGYSRSEAIGRTTLDLGMWPYPEERAALMEQVKKSSVVRDFPIRLKVKSGVVRNCRIDANIFDIEGEPHMMGVIRDVTDESALKEQKAEVDRALLRLAQGIQGLAGEAFFELLVTDIANALRTDRAFIALRNSDTPDRLQTIAAYSEQHFVQNFEYLLAGSPCEHIMANGLYVFSSGVRTMFAKDRMLTEEGWESFAGAPIRDAAGNAVGVLAVMHTAPLNNPDLVKSLLQVFTERASSELERMRAEEALRSSERRFAAMFHASPVSMALSRFGGESEIIDVNRAFENVFLRSRDQVIGKQALELSMYCEPGDRASIVSILEQVGHIDRFETWMNRGDGTKVLIQLSGSLFEVNNEKFMIITGEDVTEKHMIENEILELNVNLEIRVAERTEELQQANQELETTLDTLNLAQEELVRTEKLAALGSLVAGIAHELNTPIGNSLMVASTLIDRTRVVTESLESGLKRSALEAYLADAAKAGDILMRNLQKAGNLVTSFKQVAVDQTSSQRRSFALSEVIGEIVLTMSPAIRKFGIKVKQDVPNKIHMDGYPGPLGQVVTNLVNNALMHAFDGRKSGIISITAQTAGEEWVELAVKDNGVGIAPANINRIFDPFFTTKLGAGGTGLGLNITHTLVTSVLGGRIRVQSELGSGTTFLLTLPLQAPQREAEEDSEKVKSLFG